VFMQVGRLVVARSEAWIPIAKALVG
jgi:hypothetical protein